MKKMSPVAKKTVAGFSLLDAGYQILDKKISAIEHPVSSI
jgi:hypothetical protein